jgi:hypothetical protein
LHTVHNARCQAFEKALAELDGPYYQLYMLIFEELVAKLNNIQHRLIRTIESIFAEIQHEIDMACKRRDDHRPEAQAFRREVLRQTQKLRIQFAEKIRPLLAEAEEMAKRQREEERPNHSVSSA